MDQIQLQKARQQVRSIFDAGVARVKGFNAAADFLRAHPLEGEYYLIAVGKAASSMTVGALSVLGDQVVDGLMITKHDHTDAELKDFPNIKCMESDHPVPGDHSIKAGNALLEFIEQAPADAKFLVLFSGGASSLMEVLVDGMSLPKLTELTSTLLAIGFDITQMNQVRRTVSRIKGGRLAGYINGRVTTALLISDVPGDDPAVIGSGPLTPVHEDITQVDLPAEIRSVLAGITLMPVPDNNAFAHIDTHVIATLEDAKQAAAASAKALGLEVTVHTDFLEGDAGAKAVAICQQLSASAKGIHIWGGETAVTLPSNPGRGGRNQHLALVAALALQGADDIVFLAAGTDGTDGPTNDAGGLVDGGTIARGQAHELDANSYINNADAGNYLEKTGDLVTTGPTGTNVMDLIIALKA